MATVIYLCTCCKQFITTIVHIFTNIMIFLLYCNNESHPYKIILHVHVNNILYGCTAYFMHKSKDARSRINYMFTIKNNAKHEQLSGPC